MVVSFSWGDAGSWLLREALRAMELWALRSRILTCPAPPSVTCPAPPACECQVMWLDSPEVALGAVALAVALAAGVALGALVTSLSGRARASQQDVGVPGERPDGWEEDASSYLRAGEPLLVWYDDDNVWHERVAIYPGDELEWYVLTTDKDLYPEDMSLLDDGPSKLKALVAGRRLPRAMSKAVYRFRERLADDELRKWIRKARSALRRRGGARLSDPDWALDDTDRVVRFSEFMGEARPGSVGRRH